MEKKRVTGFKNLIPGIISLIVILVDMALRNRDQLDSVTGNIFFRLLIALLTSAPLIIFAILKREENISIAHRITLIGASIFPFLAFMVGTLRQYVLIICIYAIVIGIALAIIYITSARNEKNSIIFKYSTVVLVYVTMMLFREGMFTTFVNESMTWAFLGIGMIISALVVAVKLIFVRISNQGDEDNKPGTDKLVTNAITLLLICGMVVWTLLLNLNYALDDGPSDISAYEIVDMSVHTGKNRSYNVYVDIGGSRYRFDVSSDEYYDLEVGNYIYISYYDGFFNAPFYKFE